VASGPKARSPDKSARSGFGRPEAGPFGAAARDGSGNAETGVYTEYMRI